MRLATDVGAALVPPTGPLSTSAVMPRRNTVRDVALPSSSSTCAALSSNSMPLTITDASPLIGPTANEPVPPTPTPLPPPPHAPIRLTMNAPSASPAHTRMRFRARPLQIDWFICVVSWPA